MAKDTAAETVVITGAFSYTGKYATRLLLSSGYKIRTLTFHPERENLFVLTWEEYKGLMDGLLAPQGPSTGETRLSHWLAENREHIGKQYASEVARHYVLTSQQRKAQFLRLTPVDASGIGCILALPKTSNSAVTGDP